MICVRSIISVTYASYYSEVNLHGFVKILKFRVMRKYTLHLALDSALCGATKCRYKCENIIDLSTIIWNSKIKVFVL